jgi:hypothetical protein
MGDVIKFNIFWGANSSLCRQKRVKDFDIISIVQNFLYQDLSKQKILQLSIVSKSPDIWQ